jgi:hypothetical protein
MQPGARAATPTQTRSRHVRPTAPRSCPAGRRCHILRTGRPRRCRALDRTQDNHRAPEVEPRVSAVFRWLRDVIERRPTVRRIRLVTRDRDIEVNDSFPSPHDRICSTAAMRVEVDDQHSAIAGARATVIECSSGRAREPVEGAEPGTVILRRVMQATRQRAGIPAASVAPRAPLRRRRHSRSGLLATLSDPIESRSTPPAGAVNRSERRRHTPDRESVRAAPLSATPAASARRRRSAPTAKMPRPRSLCEWYRTRR